MTMSEKHSDTQFTEKKGHCESKGTIFRNELRQTSLVKKDSMNKTDELPIESTKKPSQSAKSRRELRVSVIL